MIEHVRSDMIKVLTTDVVMLGMVLFGINHTKEGFPSFGCTRTGVSDLTTLDEFGRLNLVQGLKVSSTVHEKHPNIRKILFSIERFDVLEVWCDDNRSSASDMHIHNLLLPGYVNYPQAANYAHGLESLREIALVPRMVKHFNGDDAWSTGLLCEKERAYSREITKRAGLGSDDSIAAIRDYRTARSLCNWQVKRFNQWRVEYTWKGAGLPPITYTYATLSRIGNLAKLLEVPVMKTFPKKKEVSHV